MTTEQIRQAHRALPFRPFDLYLADSRRVSINHPEQLMFSTSGRTIGVATPDDTIETIDILLVVSVKQHSKGSTPRRRQRP